MAGRAVDIIINGRDKSGPALQKASANLSHLRKMMDAARQGQSMADASMRKSASEVDIWVASLKRAPLVLSQVETRLGRFRVAMRAANQESSRAAMNQMRGGMAGGGAGGTLRAASAIGGVGRGLSMGAGIGVGGGLAVAAGVGAAMIAKKSITDASSMEQSRVAFKTLLGDAESAKKLISELQVLGAKTPFEFPGLRDAGKQMLAFGFSAKEIPGELRKLGDVASGLDLELGDLAMLYGTTRVEGRLFAKDLRQFTSRGIPLIQELAKQFGVTDSEVNKLVSDGKVGFADVSKALDSMTSSGGKFFNMMNEQSETMAGQWSNLKDQITMATTALGEKWMPTLKGSIALMRDMMEFGVLDVRTPDFRARKHAQQLAPVSVEDLRQRDRDTVTKDPKLQQNLLLQAEQARQRLGLDRFKAEPGDVFFGGKRRAELRHNLEPIAREADMAPHVLMAAREAQLKRRETLQGIGGNLGAAGQGLGGAAAQTSKDILRIFREAGQVAGGELVKAIADDSKRRQGGLVEERANQVAELKRSLRNPQEIFADSMRELAGMRGLDPETKARREKQLRDELTSATKPEKMFERPGLAATESRFLTRAPGAGVNPQKEMAKQTAIVAKVVTQQLTEAKKQTERLDRLVEQVFGKETVKIEIAGAGV